MTTPSDLKAALVEAMATAADPEAFRPKVERPHHKHLWERRRHRAREVAAVHLAALPPVLERFGCKVTQREPSESMWGTEEQDRRFPDIYTRYAHDLWKSMHDAAPTVPWEEK